MLKSSNPLNEWLTVRMQNCICEICTDKGRGVSKSQQFQFLPAQHTWFLSVCHDDLYNPTEKKCERAQNTGRICPLLENVGQKPLIFVLVIKQDPGFVERSLTLLEVRYNPRPVMFHSQTRIPRGLAGWAFHSSYGRYVVHVLVERPCHYL